jgi:hypothetical protein
MQLKQALLLTVLPVLAFGRFVARDESFDLEPRMLRTGAAKFQGIANAVQAGVKGRNYNTINWSKTAQKYVQNKQDIKEAEEAAKAGIIHMENTANWDKTHDYTLRWVGSLTC